MADESGQMAVAGSSEVPGENPASVVGEMAIGELAEALAAQQRLQAQLDRTSQELRDFAYIVSHDLKAPLRAIKTLIDWISTDYADKLDGEGRDQMGLLVNRVDRLNRLLEGVLEYSRIGRIREPLVPVRLNELVPEIIEALAPPDHILVTIENELPVIVAEPTRIRQVFEHLIGNAVQFMDKARGLVAIRSSGEGDVWTFSVTDNGPGIPEQHYEKIFKIFQTLAAKDQVDTTGVGLTLVKKIIEMYGGRVWLTSEVGKGTTFYFTYAKHPITDLVGAGKEEQQRG